jgi:hypothetical protein
MSMHYLRVNLLGSGPCLIKKEFTRPRSHKGSEPLVLNMPAFLERKVYYHLPFSSVMQPSSGILYIS